MTTDLEYQKAINGLEASIKEKSKAPKAVIYSRVSTQEQDYTNQIEALLVIAQQRGFECKEIYAEQESAWKAGHQRELARLFNNAHRGQFSVILVWSLDRLSREGSLAILEIVNKFHKLGIKILSYQEPWTEAPGPVGEILYALTGWVAKMESDRRSESTKAGLDRLRAQGKILGRPIGAKDRKRRRRRSL